MPAVNDLDGVRSMLAERVLEWTKEWRQEGWDEGYKTGESALLLRLVERKFGPVSEVVRQKLSSADAETLLTWADRVLDARRIEDVIA